MRDSDRSALGFAVRRHREESDREPGQFHRPVRALAVELQSVTRTQRVAGVTVPVDHGALQQVDQLGPGMLEKWKDFAGLGQGDDHGLHPLVWTAERAEQFVEVSVPRTAPDDLRTVSRR